MPPEPRPEPRRISDLVLRHFREDPEARRLLERAKAELLEEKARKGARRAAKRARRELESEQG